jgi:hypothetical protein
MTIAVFMAGCAIAGIIDGVADLLGQIPQRKNENARRRKKHG